MKNLLAIIYLISLISSFYSLPHFIYDGIESFHECLGDTDKISFTIYGSISEEIDPSKMLVSNYIIDDMGEFQCSLLKNEESGDEKRIHKIICSISGIFERKAYIIGEMKVHGFDFLNDKGESTWPKQAEKKTFLIGKCGEKIELNKEPLLLGNLAEYANPIKNVRKDMVDKAISNLPSRKSVDLDSMVNSMKNAKKSYSLSQVETAFLVYKWISQNINYDCYAYYHGKVPVFSAKETYEVGKTVCAGYSLLFEYMGDNLDIETHYVTGYAKGASWVDGKIPTSSNHAWNAIKLGSSYYLIDVTWGSGSCDGDVYSPNYRENYFCSRPEAFIRSHLPAEEKWQLISPTITLEQFAKMLDLTLDFFDLGFKTVSPDMPTITTNGELTIKLTYESKVAILTNLYSDITEGKSDTCWTQYHSTSVDITCRTNYRGTYKINLFSDVSGKYNFLLSYNINCTKTATNPLKFPYAWKDFHNYEMEIVEPFYDPLVRGNFIKAKFKSTLVEKLFIRTSKYTRELDNNGKGEFTTEDFYVVGDDVYVYTEKNGQAIYLIKYTTIRDPQSSIDASYPGVYSTAPKNILYSPLFETLQIGKSYYFKIKCESATNIHIQEQYEFFPLTKSKSGSIFSGFYQIKGTGDNIYVLDINGPTRTYLYYYKKTK